MKKAFRIMLSTMLACLLIVGMMSTAMAATADNQDPTYGPNEQEPANQIYYPDYDWQEEEAQEPAAQEPAPVSPKTGDNGMTVVVLMGAAACVAVVAGRKALRA